MSTTSPLTVIELRARACKPRSGAAMSAAKVSAQLVALRHWHLVDGAIEHTYSFNDYYDTMAFVNALAFVTHHEDHHPDLTVSYNRCKVRYSTHSVGGISLNDFICAAKCDELAEKRAQHRA
jgi:4a-hydroxytetrahydrobiopterin dehydratase